MTSFINKSAASVRAVLTADPVDSLLDHEADGTGITARLRAGSLTRLVAYSAGAADPMLGAVALTVAGLAGYQQSLIAGRSRGPRIGVAIADTAVIALAMTTTISIARSAYAVLAIGALATAMVMFGIGAAISYSRRNSETLTVEPSEVLPVADPTEEIEVVETDDIAEDVPTAVAEAFEEDAVDYDAARAVLRRAYTSLRTTPISPVGADIATAEQARLQQRLEDGPFRGHVEMADTFVTDLRKTADALLAATTEGTPAPQMVNGARVALVRRVLAELDAQDVYADA